MRHIARGGDKPIPENIQDYLNTAQLAELHKIEGFGWRLKFVRRPAFQDSVAVVTNPDESTIGVLENDGYVNMDTDIVVR